MCVYPAYPPPLTLQTGEKKLAQSLEELAANRTQLSGLEAQVLGLKKSRTALDMDLGQRDERLQQQADSLQELQKLQVSHANRAENCTHYQLFSYKIASRTYLGG